MYCVICALWTFLETTVLWFLVDYCPLYPDLKLVFFVWLVHPEYLGASWLWYCKLQPVHKKLDDQYYAKVIGALETAKVPESLKTQPPVDSNKDLVVEGLLKNK